jgi:hypothetical protein
MAWKKVIEIQLILDNIWQLFQVILTIFTQNILGFFTELNKKLWDFMKAYER